LPPRRNGPGSANFWRKTPENLAPFSFEFTFYHLLPASKVATGGGVTIPLGLVLIGVGVAVTVIVIVIIGVLFYRRRKS
jgi:hypothetical protein